MHGPQQKRPHIGLFVTCLVDLFRPSVGFAAVKLLEEAGCAVDVPAAQTCCGGSARDPADRDDARAAAKSTIEAFEAYDYVVAPSGSCAGALKRQCGALFRDDPEWDERAKSLAAKVHELTGFLVDVLGVSAVAARMKGSVTYHDGCPCESGGGEQPRRLLRSVEGLKLKEMDNSGACCGLRANGSGIAPHIREAGAGILLAGDLACLMNMARQLRRDGSAIEVRHVAEVLAGMSDAPPIGGMARPRVTSGAG